jgi:hypothetical protein
LAFTPSRRANVVECFPNGKFFLKDSCA